MKLLIDDTTGREHNLNANEACVYAAILKCTKAGRGWFANFSDLANALPFVVSDETVRRAVKKLFHLGLLEKRGNAIFAKPQIVADTPQNVVAEPQNVADAPQNVANPDTPYNPLILNNENMKENDHATCAQTCDTRTTPPIPSFDDLVLAFRNKGGRMNNYEGGEARDAWSACTSAKKIQLLAAVQSGAHFKSRLDWLIADFPEPSPTFLRGDEDEDIVQVRYNGGYKLCSRSTQQLFGLLLVRDWPKHVD